MKITQDIDTAITALEANIRPLQHRVDQLRDERKALLSWQFIEANNITRADVEMSSGDDRPYFGVIETFAKWMKNRGTHKRFAEWNGTIYFTTDLLNGRMPRDMPARTSDLND